MNCNMANKKRRRSWGSVTTITRDKHVLRWMENTENGRKRRSRTVRCSYREACQELARLQVAHADDRPVPTVGECHDVWWLPWMQRRIADGLTKQKTFDNYELNWKTHAKQRWENVPVDSVKPVEVQKWLLELPHATANVSLTILRRICDFAVQYEVVESNKFRISYEIPKQSAYKKRGGLLTLEQADAALSELRGSLVEAPFILACFGGTRTGEACGARADEVTLIEFHGVRMALVPIVRMVGEKGCDATPDGVLKNAQSVRTAAIPEPYGTRLHEIACALLSDGREWLADRGDGLPLNTHALNRLWEPYSLASDVPFANLRKSWRTFAQYDWGIDYDTLELLMGHKLPGVTGTHYLKPSPEKLAEALAKAYAKSGFLRKVQAT